MLQDNCHNIVMICNHKSFKHHAIRWIKLNDWHLNNTGLAWVYPWACHQCHKGLQKSCNRRMAQMTLTSPGSLNWLTKSQLTANDTIDISKETKLSLQVTSSHLKTQETKMQSHIICCHEQSLYCKGTMSHSINVQWQAEKDFFPTCKVKLSPLAHFWQTRRKSAISNHDQFSLTKHPALT